MKDTASKQYLTKEGKVVTDRIEQGLTAGFLERTTAVKYALKKRSYVYDLYARVKKGIKEETIHYGYAVPN